VYIFLSLDKPEEYDTAFDLNLSDGDISPKEKDSCFPDAIVYLYLARMNGLSDSSG